MHDDTVKEKFVYLRSRGMSYGKIAKEIKASKATLVKWNNDFKNEISKQRAEFKNELREKYLISDIQRMEFFGERLKNVRSEIKSKGLSDLKINQLLGLEVKYIKCLEGL